MTGEADLVFLRHGNDALEEIRDPFPVDLVVDRPGGGQRRILLRLGVDERAVAGTAAADGGRAARNADERQVVLDRGNAGARGIADHRADVVDLLVAIGRREQNRGRFTAGDFARAERQRHHVERQAERFDVLAAAGQRVDRPCLIQFCGRQPAADVIDPEAGEHAQNRVGVAVLRPGFHPDAGGRRWLAVLRLGGDSAETTASAREPAVSPEPAILTKSRRFIEASTRVCGERVSCADNESRQSGRGRSCYCSSDGAAIAGPWR